MTNEEALQFYATEVEKYLRLKEALEQAAVMVYGKGKTTRDNLLEAAEYMRREAEDNQFMLEETKIHIEKSRGVT